MHAVRASSLAFSPDGTKLATLGDPAEGGTGGVRWTQHITIWDVATGEAITTLVSRPGLDEGSRSQKLLGNRLAFRPDGARLAAALDDGTVELWDVVRRRQAVKLDGHRGRVSSVAFSPDSRWLVSGGEDGTVRLWDADTGAALAIAEGPNGVTRVSFSPDCQRIASVGQERSLKVRDAPGLQELLSITPPSGEQLAVSFTSDGHRIALANNSSTIATTSFPELSRYSDYKKARKVGYAPLNEQSVPSIAVRMWNPETGGEEGAFGGQGGRAFTAVFSLDGARLAGFCLDGTIRVWDTTTGANLVTLRPLSRSRWIGDIVAMAFSPDGKQLATAGADGLEVWNAVSGHGAAILGRHFGPCQSVMFSPDGKLLATTGRDRTVRLWDAGTGAETLALKNSRRVAFAPASGRLASVDEQEGAFHVWDVNTRQRLLTLKFAPGHVGAMAGPWFSADGASIFAWDGHIVNAFDSTTGQKSFSFAPHSERTQTCTLSPDGRFLGFLDLEFGPRRRMVTIWSLSTGKQVLQLDCTRRLPGMPYISQFSRDCRRLVIVTMSGFVMHWEDPAGPASGLLPGHTGKTSFFRLDSRRTAGDFPFLDDGHSVTSRLSALDLDPDCRTLAVCFDHVVRLWDLATGRERLTLNSGADAIERVYFSPDGSVLVSEGAGVAKAWNADTGQKISSLAGRAAENSWAFSPDGRRIATTGHSGTTVYDVRTGRPMLSFAGHAGGWANDVAFSPDGRQIASVGEDRTVRVWDSETGREILRINCDARPTEGKEFRSSATQKFVQQLDGEDSIRRAAARSHDGQLTDRRRPDRDGSLRRVVFSPDGRRLAWSGSDRTVTWDREKGCEILSMEGHPVWFTGLGFSPDGARLACASPDALLRVWDTNSGLEAVGFEGQSRLNEQEAPPSTSGGDRAVTDKYFTTQIQALAYSPDGRLIAASYSMKSGTITIWSASIGQKLLDLETNFSALFSTIAFSADSQRVASGGYRATTDRNDVCVWDAARGKLERLFIGHTDVVTDLAFSPDGRRLASSSLDGTVRIWDVETGLGVLTLDEHAGGVEGIAFSPDGRRLASANHDGTIRVWDARDVEGEQ